MYKNHFFFFLLFLASLSTYAQQDFFQKQNKVFERACDQWMVKELTSIYPSHFAEKNYQGAPYFNIPTSKELVLGMTGNYDAEMAERFYQLYFPKNKKQRYLQLQSLCDLYFPLIEKKLHNAGLPKSYKYLPLVLSGMNPKFEDDRDRAGLFALDYLTARYHNLRIDSVVDERRGSDYIVDIAIKEIKSLREKFNGDDELVLKAIYVSRAYAQRLYTTIEKEHTAIDDEADLFVSFFVFTDRLFNQVFLKVNNQLPHYFDILGQFENLSFRQPVYFDALKELTAADVSVLKEVNPIFIGNKIEAEYRRASFILQNTSAEKFRLLEDSVYAWVPQIKPVLTETITIEEKSYHVVRRGESLGVIAQKHRTSISNLKKWNNLRSDRIQAGQRLVIQKTVRKRVPISEELEPDTVPAPSTPAPVVVQPKPEPTPAPQPSANNFVIYKVKNGDSLWLIAKKYNTTPEKIMALNNCGEKIRPDQKLKIPKE